MNKKFLAKILAVSMVLTAAPYLPGMKANAEELSTGSQTGGGYLDLIGSSRGDGEETEYSNPFVNKDTSNGIEIVFDVEPTGQVNVLGTLFAITTSSGRMYFTPGSYLGYNAGGQFFDANLKDYSLVEDYIGDGGNVSIKITSTGFEVSVDGNKCYDQSILETENGAISDTGSINYTKVLEFFAEEGSLTFGKGSWWEDNKANAKISNFICKLADGTVVGEYYNDGTVLDLNPGDTGDGDEDTDNSGSTGEPGTDFSKITTQPVVKYTFDNAEGIELAGEANVADGVLNLATKESDDVTYAKFSDLSTFDFSNGITLTTDVKVTGYKSDWTPIFMLGDGTLGGEGNDATGLYHLSQGFSSVGGSRASVTDTADWFIGYFGSGIATPYKWDWYNETSNRNRWDTITVTINNNKMSTYIDGQLVQSAEGDYTKVLDAIKVAKNNYLGASYWKADGYFQGSLDNVGIYNTVLSADDISKLTSTKGENVVITTPKPLAPYPVVLPTPELLPTPEPLPTASPADENATPEPTPVLEPETITGVAWWDAANERSRDYVLSGEGTMDLYVTFESTSDSNGYGAFNVELVSDGNRYITTGSDTNAWTGEQGTGTVSCPNLTNSTIIPGHVYRITIKRTNYDFSIIYYDLTDNKEYCSMEIKDTNQAVDVNIHVMAQVGKYIVSQKASDVTAPSASATPAPSADPSASPDPSATAEPGSTEAPGTTDPGTNPGDKDPGTDNPAENPSDDDDKKDNETKKTVKVSGITAKAGKKKVTGKLSVKGTKVTVKIGSKKAKNAKVNGKKFTFTALSKLKKGTKVTIKVTKSGYKAVTKTVKVK